MRRVYARWMDRWERKLATRDTNRQIRPFQWGLEWLQVTPNGDPRGDLEKAVARSLAASEEFYSYRSPADFQLNGDRLTFTSPLESPHPENNTVHARFLPGRGDRAVLVMPQWNASADGHIGLCKLLNRFGITALRMSLAYHDARKPEELARADYHMSSNLGRTIHACRQSVVDARACLDWLESRGYRRLAVLGTSLGSCIAFIAAAHDSRVKVQVCNHVSNWVGDVVWTGLSTRHVRQGFGDTVTQDELRRYWSVISPASYFDRLVGRDIRTMLIWTSYDSTFLPEYSREVIREFERRGLSFQVVNLPCGHYTLGQFPFNWLDGLAMCRFLDRHL